MSIKLEKKTCEGRFEWEVRRLYIINILKHPGERKK